MKTRYLIVLGPIAEDKLGGVLAEALAVAPLFQVNPQAQYEKPKKMKAGITRMQITPEMKRSMQGLRATGYSSQQIAELIGCSRQSVKRHAPGIDPAPGDLLGGKLQ